MGFDKKQIDQELTLIRLVQIIQMNKKLGSKLLHIGYPDGYPEKYRELEKAYKNLREALILVVCEEAKVLETLK